MATDVKKVVHGWLIWGTNKITNFSSTKGKYFLPEGTHPLQTLHTLALRIQKNETTLDAQRAALTQCTCQLDMESQSALGKHPLQELYILLLKMERSEISESREAIETALGKLDQSSQNTLHGHVYQLATDSDKGGDRWGALHAADNPSRLREAVKRLVLDKLENLGQEEKNALYGAIYILAGRPSTSDNEWGKNNATSDIERLIEALFPPSPEELAANIQAFAIKKFKDLKNEERGPLYGTIYSLAGRPTTSDAQWGENNATADTGRLIAALHCQGKIGGPGRQVEYLQSWENATSSNRSSLYDLNRKALEKGEIGYINGMGCSFNLAKSDATRLSDSCGQGYNFHCVYAAAQEKIWDISSALIGQGGTLMPQARLLHQRWTEFFARSEPNSKYLQICHSKGAIDVFTALNQLSVEQRQRMIVITSGPAYIIPKELAYKVVNLVIKEDGVPFLSPNKHLIDSRAPEVHILPNHADKSDPHDPHGSSYKAKMQPLLDSYIKNNDI